MRSARRSAAFSAWPIFFSIPTLAPDQTTYVTAVKSSGEALLELIDDILDFSKIEAGHLDLAEKPFAPAPLVEEVVELLAPRAHHKGIEISAHVTAGTPALVLGDGGRVKQVLLNLAGNAVKFTAKGGVAVRAGASPEGLWLSVEDSGVGIAPEHLPLIFREFEQGDQTPARHFGGTGLGLAISQRIVVAMGGTIHVASTVGLGSAFRVELPLAIVSAAAPPFLRTPVRVLIASPSATPSHPLGPTLGPTLLAMLGEVGAQGVLAAGLDHARERIAAEPFAAVLVDRTLGGDEVADLLGAARGRGIRGIVLLAPAERHELDRLKAAGASGYLIKPIRMASLIEQLEGRRWRSCEPDGQLAPAAPLGGRSVLLADDNDINALVARTMLGRLGAEVVWARDGSEAVEAFRRRRFDAVLLDMQMPGLDGPAAARLIRAAERASERRRTPIFALTANGRAEDRDHCLAAGMDAFLVKPIDRDGLLALFEPAPASAA